MSKHRASEEWNEQHSKKVKRTNQSPDNESAEEDAYTSFEGRCSATELEDTHEDRPLSYTSDDHIVLESFTLDYQRAQELLFAIAEPIHDLERSHIYKITANSLHTAMFFGLNTESILKDLHELSKTSVPACIINLIKSCTAEYGKVRLVLKQNRYFLECISSHVLTTLLQDPQIQECRLASTGETVDTSLGGSENIQSTSFEVNQAKVVMLRKRCQQLKYPLVEDYASAEDTLIPNLKIQLSSKATLRPYQEESLRKVFNNGRARSGVIVLPCGAGKSLVGVAAACTINKRCLILCNSNVSVEQWREQFKMWSTANDNIIRLLTSKNKNNFNNSGICISTYQMVASNTGHSADTSRVLKLLKNHDWGLILLDEVHMCPADSFRRILNTVRAHIKLGLTATPVREDDRITDLNFLVGPSLYEANWMALQNAGFIATVRCAEVQCAMTPEFFRQYRLTSDDSLKRRLSVFNPNKFRACQALIEYHEQRNDKIIVFCDDVSAVRVYALKLVKPFIHGKVSHSERMILLQNFQRNPKINTIFISRVGDAAFDLPEANVVIQLSSHGSSRRQEAQRLGRILRSKRNAGTSGNNAFFYSLMSEETDEMSYSSGRQRFLKERGYSYEKLSDANFASDQTQLQFSTSEQQEQLLQEVLTMSDQEENEKVKKPPASQKKAKPIHPLFRLFRK